MDVPPSLRLWFLVHAVVDLVAALPLLFAPATVLGYLGWTSVDPVATRLVGAALLGIGGESFFMRNAGAEAYRAMVGLKVIWSLTACAALLASIGGGAPPAAWAFLCIFLVFAGVWVHHAIRFRQLRNVTDEPLPEAGDDEAADNGA
jgi:hypothetical protein